MKQRSDITAGPRNNGCVSLRYVVCIVFTLKLVDSFGNMLEPVSDEIKMLSCHNLLDREHSCSPP